MTVEFHNYETGERGPCASCPQELYCLSLYVRSFALSIYAISKQQRLRKGEDFEAERSANTGKETIQILLAQLCCREV
jgi:hypothetical protein